MAVYVSRYARDCQILRVEEKKYVYVQGEAVPHVTKPAIIAQFEPGLESNYERQFALAAFSGKLEYHPEDGTVSFGEYLISPEGYQMRIGGAMPETTARTIGIPGTSSVMQTQAYDITQKMGRFDSAEQGWDRDTQLEAERLLDLHAGQDYFKVGRSRVIPPWPTYDEMRKGQGAYEKILARVKEMGYDPIAVRNYEEQMDKPFDGIIRVLTEYADELAQAAADDAALSGMVN